MTMLNGPQPIRGSLGASVIGPRNLPIERENPDQLAPPHTDSGTVPSDRFADVSLNQWMALTPPELVQAHLSLDERTTSALSRDKPIVVR